MPFHVQDAVLWKVPGGNRSGKEATFMGMLTHVFVVEVTRGVLLDTDEAIDKAKHRGS
jgi:hypothetical protein